MKKLMLLAIVFLLCIVNVSEATFNSGSTGADGAFNPSTNTVLQVPPNGIFNYTAVNIPAGVTVTFTKNAANTPVYILTTGDVTIAGTIDVSGISATTSVIPGMGGPGGYDGGYGGGASIPGGKGKGPGGGEGGYFDCYWGGWYGGGGSFGSSGGQFRNNCGAAGSTYGNDRIAPLIGGSGGGGSSNGGSAGYGGGGGGGALLIASSGSIIVNGSLLANGGGISYNSNSAGGSGGGIKLIANSISGYGSILARGGSEDTYQKGGKGRIRIEAYVNNFTPGTDPPYSYSNSPGSVFTANQPSLIITSIAGANVPSNPTGSYAQPDITLPSNTTNPVTINISASYIPAGTQVTVAVIPQYGTSNSNTATLGGSLQSSTGSATVNLSTTYSNVITARATYVLQEALYWDGEKIEKVRVAAVMGKQSEVFYITESGKEIKYEVLAGKLPI